MGNKTRLVTISRADTEGIREYLMKKNHLALAALSKDESAVSAIKKASSNGCKDKLGGK